MTFFSHTNCQFRRRVNLHRKCIISSRSRIGKHELRQVKAYFRSQDPPSAQAMGKWRPWERGWCHLPRSQDLNKSWQTCWQTVGDKLASPYSRQLIHTKNYSVNVCQTCVVLFQSNFPHPSRDFTSLVQNGLGQRKRSNVFFSLLKRLNLTVEWEAFLWQYREKESLMEVLGNSFH